MSINVNMHIGSETLIKANSVRRDDANANWISICEGTKIETILFFKNEEGIKFLIAKLETLREMMKESHKGE